MRLQRHDRFLRRIYLKLSPDHQERNVRISGRPTASSSLTFSLEYNWGYYEAPNTQAALAYSSNRRGRIHLESFHRNKKFRRTVDFDKLVRLTDEEKTHMHSLQEKNELLQRVDGVRERLMAAVAGLSQAQAGFKPSSEAWSVAGVVEHLATVEDLVIMRLEKMASEPNHGIFKDSDVVLFDKVVDRTKRFQSPERVQPTGKSLGSSL